MNTLEALAISVAGMLLVYLYDWYRWQKCQQALQWFYAKQSCTWSAQAETVREQLFQKAFALRRAVELGSLSASEDSSEHFNRCLSLSKEVNLALEQVSNKLSEPFLEESLPLALQYFAKHWDEETDLTLDLPSDWSCQQTAQYRLLLWCLGECLEIWQSCLNQTLPKALKLALSQDKNMAKLQVTFSGQMLEGISISAKGDELSNVQQVFKVLMPGRCQLKYNNSQFIGEFGWPLATKDSELRR